MTRAKRPGTRHEQAAAHLNHGVHGAVRWRPGVVRAGAPGVHRNERACKPRVDAYRPGRHASADRDTALFAGSVTNGQPHPVSKPVAEQDAAARARDSDPGHHADPNPAHAGNVTDVLAKRDAQLTMLISDGDLVLQTLNDRRQIINQLLKSTSDLSAQLSGLVRDNKAALKPLLTNLQGVISVLQKDSAQLYRTVQTLGPFVRVFTNTLGNGHWFDTYIDTAGLSPGLRLPASGASK